MFARMEPQRGAAERFIERSSLEFDRSDNHVIVLFGRGDGEQILAVAQ